jgi:signal transduction histidine kinase
VDSVLADPEELKSVFVNLLVNAEEAMPSLPI